MVRTFGQTTEARGRLLFVQRERQSSEIKTGEMDLSKKLLSPQANENPGVTSVVLPRLRICGKAVQSVETAVLTPP